MMNFDLSILTGEILEEKLFKSENNKNILNKIKHFFLLHFTKKEDQFYFILISSSRFLGFLTNSVNFFPKEEIKRQKPLQPFYVFLFFFDKSFHVSKISQLQ